MPTSCHRPKNWPETVPPITYEPYPRVVDLDAAVIQQPRSSLPAGPAGLVVRRPSAPVAHVRIAAITAPSSHPALGQHGLFAARQLAPNSFILLYSGCLYGPESPQRPPSDYDLSLARDLGIGIDAARCGNEARFINDYRGVRADGPNAEFRDVWIEVPDAQRKGRLDGKTNCTVMKGIGVFVLAPGKAGRRKSGIAKGDEILVSYGKGFWSHRRTGELAGGAEEGASPYPEA